MLLEFNCNTDLILRKGRKKNTASDVALYLSRELTGDSSINLEKFNGDISVAGITAGATIWQSKSSLIRSWDGG
ncbi:hypothetical protein D1AOALGA4SA_7347 [Olavius algarvensis Delta 1 endosymbiont]|nr:hypothetical protein D1AOALGA4SA_7347 [Olavius algarvensis Delta 1 endosymbiont]